jgi:hypothetical protein
MRSFTKTGLLFLSGIAFVAGCSSDTDPVTGTPVIDGSGVMAEENRAVSGFSGVSFASEGSIWIDTGAQEALRVRAADNLLPYLISEVQGSDLLIRTAGGVDLQPTRSIEFHVTAVDMDRFVLAGVGSAYLSNMTGNQLSLISSGVGSVECSGLNVDALSSTVSGVGGVSTEGLVDEQIVTVTGVGDYSGADLASRLATVTIGGLGSVTVRVSERLVVTFSGAGIVYYIGDPVVERTGTGRVEKIG